MSGIVALAIVLAAFVLQWPHLYARLAARHWAGRLATAPAAELEDILAQLAALGPAGFPPLVEALDSPRVELADSASHVLADRIDAWMARPDGDAPARLVALATRLAEHSEPFGPGGRVRAAALASRLLRGRIDPASAEVDAAILDACATVLRRGDDATARRGTPDPSPSARSVRQPTDAGLNASALSRSRTNGVANPTGDDPRGSEAGHDPYAFPGPSHVADDPARLAHLPGGGLPAPELSALAHAADALSAPEQGPAGAMPGLLPPELTTPAAARPLDPRAGAPRPNAGAEISRTPGQRAPESRGPDDRSDAGPRADRTDRARTIDGRLLSTDATPDGLAESAGRDTAGDLSSLDVIAVMRRLHVSDAADSAERELARRGFSAAQIDLARRLHHPDATVRRELAARLPELPGIDSAAWLLQLAQDSDSEVRLTALGLLMTAADPNVAAEATRLAAGDGNPRIRRLAERLGAPGRAPGKSSPQGGF